MPLVDERYDPPRMSGWWTAYAVIGVVVGVSVVVAAAGDGRWFTAIAFSAITANAVYQYVLRRRRHREALAAFRSGGTVRR